MNGMDPKTSQPDAKLLKIAFTYDRCSDWMALGLSAEQCAEFASDNTIEGISASLRKLGVVEMIGGMKSLAKSLISRTEVDWDLVFNLCEGYGTSSGREAQVPALLEAWNIPFTFSDSATLTLCLDKAKTKVRTPHFFSVKYGSLISFSLRWYWSIMASQPLPLRVSRLERLGLHRGVVQ
jgi:D-alanine-D-alanine ligase